MLAQRLQQQRIWKHHWVNDSGLLAQRLRHWPNIELARGHFKSPCSQMWNCVKMLYIVSGKFEASPPERAFPWMKCACLQALWMEWRHFLSQICVQTKAIRWLVASPTNKNTLSRCKSMHSYDATIDLADRDTIKHYKLCADGSCYGLAYERLDWPVPMIYSFVIQAVIQVVIQAVPADSARGQRGHQDRLPTQSDWRPRALFSRPGWSVACIGQRET